MPRIYSVVIAFVLSALALCQGSFDQQMASVILLQSKVVQKELGVTTAQRAAMNKYADAHREKLKAFYERKKAQKSDSVTAADERQLSGYFNTMKRGVLAELTPSQLRRLREISLQTLDFTAIGDPMVSSRLGMSASQAAKVRSAIEAGLKQANSVRNNAIANATKGITSQDQADRAAEAASNQVDPEIILLRNQTKQKVMALLTAQQRARWQLLLGRPFKG